MGTKLSVSVEGAFQPEIAPRNDRPATFDPQYGFEHPRKPRVMQATWEEMDQYNLIIKPGLRDYCAHLLITLMRCQTENAPFAGHTCDSARSAWDKCEYDDYIMRIKREASFKPSALQRRDHPKHTDLRWWISEKRRNDYSPPREIKGDLVDSAASFRLISQAMRACSVSTSTSAGEPDSVSGALDIMMDSLMAAMAPLANMLNSIPMMAPLKSAPLTARSGRRPPYTHPSFNSVCVTTIATILLTPLISLLIYCSYHILLGFINQHA